MTKKNRLNNEYREHQPHISPLQKSSHIVDHTKLQLYQVLKTRTYNTSNIFFKFAKHRSPTTHLETYR